MPDRDKSSRSLTSVNLAGTLGKSLRHHAMERCRHFFLYMFFYKALTDRLNAKHDQEFSSNGGVSVAATHQIDSGMRITGVKRKHYYGFDETDPEIVNKAATACGETDAAHYCNLGIAPDYRDKIAHYATPEKDQGAFDLYEALKAFCGNTKWLPQRINIGPDRVIDALHGTLALRMLNGKPPVSALNRAAYLKEARAAMVKYAKTQHDLSKFGLEECTNAYIAFYDNPKKVQEMWTVITGNVTAECSALKLTLGDYLKRTVA